MDAITCADVQSNGLQVEVPPPINEEARAGGADASFHSGSKLKNDTTTPTSEQLEPAHRLLNAVLRHVEPDTGAFGLCGIGENPPVKIWRGSPSDALTSGLTQARTWNETGRNAYWGAGLVRHGLAP